MSMSQAVAHPPWLHHGNARQPSQSPGSKSVAGRQKNRPVLPPRVAASVKDGWRVFDARMVALFCADTKYTTFTMEGREYMISETLQSLEQRLRVHGFMRVHRAVLVNLFMVRALERQGRQLTLHLTSGAVAGVSRRMSQEVCQALGCRPCSQTFETTKKPQYLGH